jgi:hypothetical protein
MITSNPGFFEESPQLIAQNAHILKLTYDELGGKNFVVFCRTQLGQNLNLLKVPKILDDISIEMKSIGMSSGEVLKLMPQLAGILPDLSINVIRTG